MLSLEVPVIDGLFQADMILDLKTRQVFNIALEVQNPISKNFRIGYSSPYERVREKIMLKHGGFSKLINIDTKSFENYE